MAEYEPLHISSPDAVAQITHGSEQQFARAILAKCPHHIIVYEPAKFLVEKPDGSVIGTIPDFSITNPNTNQTKYVEITQVDFSPPTAAEDPQLDDPKRKQKYVMSQVDIGNAKYVVLYAAHLEKIETATGIPILDGNNQKRRQSKKLKQKNHLS